MNKEQMLEFILNVGEKFKYNLSLMNAILFRIPDIIDTEGYDSYKDSTFKMKHFDLYREVIVNEAFSLLEKEGKLVFISNDSNIAMYIDVETVFSLIIRAVTINMINLDNVNAYDILRYFDEISEIEYYKITKSKYSYKIACSCAEIYTICSDMVMKHDNKYYMKKSEYKIFKNIDIDTIAGYIDRVTNGEPADIEYLESFRDKSFHKILMGDFGDIGILMYDMTNEDLILVNIDDGIKHTNVSLSELGFTSI